MRYSIPGLFSSILLLPLALGSLDIVLVTDWKDGQMKSSDLDTALTDISTLHHPVLVDNKEYTDVMKFSYVNVEAMLEYPETFSVWKDSATGTHKFDVSVSYGPTDRQCVFYLVEDPDVDLIHIMLLGDKKPYVNIFGDELKLDC
jgi:hypothetical protein